MHLNTSLVSVFDSSSEAVSSLYFIMKMNSAFGVKCGLQAGERVQLSGLDSAGSNH